MILLNVVYYTPITVPAGADPTLVYPSTSNAQPDRDGLNLEVIYAQRDRVLAGLRWLCERLEAAQRAEQERKQPAERGEYRCGCDGCVL